MPAYLEELKLILRISNQSIFHMIIKNLSKSIFVCRSLPDFCSGLFYKGTLLNGLDRIDKQYITDSAHASN